MKSYGLGAINLQPTNVFFAAYITSVILYHTA